MSEQNALTEETTKTDTFFPTHPADRQQIQAIYEQIRGHRAKLVGPDGEAKGLPASVYSFLLRLLADLEDGKSVSILQDNTELTTVQASSLLGVSRQFLINLLERGDIPFHKVGTHRRIYTRDILTFKAKRDSNRKRALEELIEAEIAEGIFARMPEDVQSR